MGFLLWWQVRLFLSAFVLTVSHLVVSPPHTGRGTPYFIDFATLLAVIRNTGQLRWDQDSDLSVEVDGNHDTFLRQLIGDLRSAGMDPRYREDRDLIQVYKTPTTHTQVW